MLTVVDKRPHVAKEAKRKHRANVSRNLVLIQRGPDLRTDSAQDRVDFNAAIAANHDASDICTLSLSRRSAKQTLTADHAIDQLDPLRAALDIERDLRHAGVLFDRDSISAHFCRLVDRPRGVLESGAQRALDFSGGLERNQGNQVGVSPRKRSDAAVRQLAEATDERFFAGCDDRDRLTATGPDRGQTNVQTKASREFGNAARDDDPNRQAFGQTSQLLLGEVRARGSP